MAAPATNTMRNKFTAMGGPDGGDGRPGAHIILRATTANLWTLLHLRYHKNVLAENREKGWRQQQFTGRDGKNIIIEVPLGTIAMDEETGKQKWKFWKTDRRSSSCRVEKGGLGNSHLQRLLTRHLSMHNLVCQIEGLKVLELKYLLMWGLSVFRMQVNQRYFQLLQY